MDETEHGAKLPAPGTSVGARDVLKGAGEPASVRRVASGSRYEDVIGFSRAVCAGDRVVVSGTAPIWPDGHCEGDAVAQARRCLEIILHALAEAGSAPSDVIRTRIYLTDPGDAPAVGRAHAEVFGDIRPASTMVVVASLLDPRWKVEIEAEAVTQDR